MGGEGEVGGRRSGWGSRRRSRGCGSGGRIGVGVGDRAVRALRAGAVGQLKRLVQLPDEAMSWGSSYWVPYHTTR